MQLSRPQIEAFAAGLYELAKSDGVHESEVAVIREFLEEAGAPELMSQLEQLEFDPVGAYELFETSWLRTLFLKAAVLLIRQDHQVTDEEREAIGWMAGAFGVEGGYEALVEQLEGEAV